jgi:formate dehydrogenase alpha subunit
MTNSIGEIANADLILACGTNTMEAHPIIWYKINEALRKGAQLIVVDPRETDMAQLATIHVRLQPGTDIALLNGLMNVIIAEDIYDKKFVKERTLGFEELQQVVAKYTPEYVETITGVPAETIRKVARAYAGAGKSTILYTMGLTQHTVGTDNVLSVANLSMLCGMIGRESTGVNPLRGQNNVQGACDMGALPNVLTAYQNVGVEAVRQKFEPFWNCQISDKPGLAVGEMMTAAGEGRIKGMYIMGENPVLSDPDANHVVHELEHLEFLVVQDIFMTETAQLADVVLPGACFAEKEGTFSSTERRVQRVRKAVEPPGMARPDWEIICGVSTAMGYPMSYASSNEIFDEMRKVTPSYAGISYQRLEKGGLQWPCPNEEHPGTPIMHCNEFVCGIGKFKPAEHVPPDEMPSAEYPLLLDTGRRLYHYHTGTMSRKTMIEDYMSSDTLEINCLDASDLEVCDGDKVRLTSRRGSIEIPVRITETVPKGLVFTSFHFSETPINQLTNPKVDAKSKIPELKVCAVRIEKIA